MSQNPILTEKTVKFKEWSFLHTCLFCIQPTYSERILSDWIKLFTLIYAGSNSGNYRYSGDIVCDCSSSLEKGRQWRALVFEQITKAKLNILRDLGAMIRSYWFINQIKWNSFYSSICQFSDLQLYNADITEATCVPDSYPVANCPVS